VHPRLRGRACRLLLEQQRLAEGELGRRASLALSPAEDAGRAAQWIEGLIAGEGMLLVHQEELLATLDEWLTQLVPEHFQAQLPLLRRAFSGLGAPDRRALAQKLKRRSGGRRDPAAAPGEAFDEARAAQLLPALAAILGVSHV
jgi:hypothetical protein